MPPLPTSTALRSAARTRALRGATALLLFSVGCAGAVAPAPPGASSPAATVAAPATVVGENDSGCSAARPCSGTNRCVTSRTARLNCGPQMCQEVALQCADASQCDAGQVCTTRPNGPWPMCQAKACKADADCDGLTTCSGGLCMGRACQADGDCAGGFCLSGACARERGTCISDQEPPYPSPR